MLFRLLSTLIGTIICIYSTAQQVDIESFDLNEQGQVLIEVNSSPEYYYLVQVRHHPDSAFSQFTSMTMGQQGSTWITEPLGAYPSDYYRVLAFPVANPGDVDDDGVDDITEYDEMPLRSPFNAANMIPMQHGLNGVATEDNFHAISTNLNNTPWIEYLDDTEYTKFLILDFFSDHPQLYFVNCQTYPLHTDFANYLGVDQTSSTVRKGQIMYIPTALSSNGTLGTYAFSFSSNDIEEFDVVQKTHELLAANMRIVENNLAYFITPDDEEVYSQQLESYENSRVPVVFETDAYAGINYWGLNQGESFGFFRLMSADEIPNPFDIVLYDQIPNVLPHVGGVITSEFQTPLSHVNLRAIQDKVPNAFIRDALENEEINALIGHYIYFKASQSTFEIREATLAEVNAWYESRRPQEIQIPLNNLSFRSILPLDSIRFERYDAFGAKVANVAEMRRFDFAEGTIPNGFGIPFYFYQEFMAYNHFFDEVDEMRTDETFMSNRQERDLRLSEFREEIENASMPSWMIDSLTELQLSFPLFASIRCRSSTNNEDLPDFSGAGLYDSKTHHPVEGHISKTIKEIFASLWNLRAFDEREFYRVDHYQSSMGVLCHINFEDELVNGVGVTTDPIYGTEDTFYLNAQLGEELITNPEGALPEELLIKWESAPEIHYSIIQYSNLIGDDTLLMNDGQLYILREYLAIIHDRFEELYHAEYNDSFAMDVEFKITSDHRLIIKQARPWVSYVPILSYVPQFNDCGATLFPNPARDEVRLGCADCGETILRIFDLNGRIVMENQVDFSDTTLEVLDIRHLPIGVYTISGIQMDGNCSALRLVKY